MLTEQDAKLYDLVNQLQSTVQLIRELEAEKKVIIDKICDIKCPPEGSSKSYQVLDAKVTITYPLEYSIDEKAYLELKTMIPIDLNPVQEVVKHKVDKKAAKELLSNSLFSDAANQFLIKGNRSKSVSVSYRG